MLFLYFSCTWVYPVGKKTFIYLLFKYAEITAYFKAKRSWHIILLVAIELYYASIVIENILPFKTLCRHQSYITYLL